MLDLILRTYLLYNFFPVPDKPAQNHNTHTDGKTQLGLTILPDFFHAEGWVWGAGIGRVTVRFETAETGPGRVRTFPVDDPSLSPWPVPAPEPAADPSGRDPR